MKLTPKGLVILAFIAFLFSPFISPIPGILLIIAAGGRWLSQEAQKQSRENAEVDEEEIGDINGENKEDITPEDETKVTDCGDHVVIIEKKIIKKVDLKYEDLVKYNLKNVDYR